MIDILGYIATTFTLLSFTVNNVNHLRLMNGIGAILWIIYGINTSSNPVVVTNAAIVLIHAYKYVSMSKTFKK